MKDNIKHLLEGRIEDIRSAPNVWMDWEKKYDFRSNDCILIFPDKINNETASFMSNVQQLVAKKGYENAHIIFSDINIEKEYSNKNNKYLFHRVNELEIKKIVELYTMFEFSNRVYICSFSLPDGRMTERVKQPGLYCSDEEIVRLGIFRLGVD